MAITLPITSRSSSDDNDFADVYGNDAQLVTEIDARDAVYTALCAVGGAVADTATAATYYFSPGEIMLQSGSNGLTIPPLGVYLDSSDYAVSSKTTKLRLRFQVSTNTVGPAITFTAGLYPVTVAGAADQVVFTLGTVTSGSTAQIASPSTSTVTSAASGDFTFPSNGLYVVGVVLSGTPTANSAAVLTAQLQMRWV